MTSFLRALVARSRGIPSLSYSRLRRQIELRLFPGWSSRRGDRPRLRAHAEVRENATDRVRLGDRRENPHAPFACGALERILLSKMAQSMRGEVAKSSPSPSRPQGFTVRITGPATRAGEELAGDAGFEGGGGAGVGFTGASSAAVGLSGAFASAHSLSFTAAGGFGVTCSRHAEFGAKTPW